MECVNYVTFSRSGVTNPAVIFPILQWEILKTEAMDINREFTFSGKKYECSTFIDHSADPCFVFVEFTDPDLIARFGAELTIKTDFEKLLPFGGRGQETELRQAIFDTLQVHPEFIHAKLKVEALKLIGQFNEANA